MKLPHAHAPIMTTPCLFHPDVRRLHDQLRRMANVTSDNQGAAKRHHSCLRSPQREEYTSGHRCSRSPQQGYGPPVNRLERRPRDSTCPFKRSKPEVFQLGAAPRGGVCAVCLGRHEHSFTKCKDAKLWDGSASAAQKSEGQLVVANGLPLCFDWQIPRGCASISHPDRHRCSGCGRPDHGAQGCSRCHDHTRL